MRDKCQFYRKVTWAVIYAAAPYVAVAILIVVWVLLSCLVTC